jgi:hypothetical protein
MKIGSSNEDPTLSKLESESFIEEIFTVGLLVRRDDPTLGVSPDGIASLTIPSGHRVFSSVEIKTRVAEKTIAAAEEVRQKHGRIVYCEANSNQFCECVPVQNRLQLFHQA